LGTVSHAVAPNLDVLTYTAAEEGWHPIVVFRDTGTDAAKPIDYDFYWNKGGFVDAPQERSDASALAFLGATPNPIRGRTGRFEFVLPQAGQARLALYDVRGRWRARSPAAASGAASSRWPGTAAARTAARSDPASTGLDSRRRARSSRSAWW